MRLTVAQKQRIRELYATGYYLQTDLARMYHVSQECISRIVRRPARVCVECGVPVACAQRCTACKAARIAVQQAAWRDRNREYINRRTARKWAEDEHYREQHRRIARESERRRYVRKRG